MLVVIGILKFIIIGEPLNNINLKISIQPLLLITIAPKNGMEERRISNERYMNSKFDHSGTSTKEIFLEGNKNILILTQFNLNTLEYLL